ncbi:MAG: methionyl-tRNA formyltransferase [bacterium]
MEHFDFTKLTVLFFGSPAFGVPTLDALSSSGARVFCVTMPDRPAGRKHVVTPPAVKRFALQRGIPLYQPEKLDEDFLREVRRCKPDIAVVAAYGKIFRKELLAIPRLGFVNVHPSLLPKYRGASPIVSTILAGDTKTGVTIMKLNEGVDTGPILASSELQLRGDETTGELTGVLAQQGAQLLLQTLPSYIKGTLQSMPQAEIGASRSPLLKKSDGELHFSGAAEQLERAVRAYTPWPGAWFSISGRRYAVLQATLEHHQVSQEPGTVVQPSPTTIGVVCGDHRTLLLLAIKPDGGQRPLSAREFLNGYRGLIGQTCDVVAQTRNTR